MVTDAQIIDGSLVFSVWLSMLGVLIAGLVWLAFRPRHPDAPRYLREVPGDLPPCVAGVLMRRGPVRETEIVATLLDLCARGSMTSQTVKRRVTGMVGAADVETVEFSVAEGAWENIPRIEQELLTVLTTTLGRHGSVGIADLRSATRARTHAFRRALGGWQASVDAYAVSLGLMRPAARTARWALYALAIVILSLGAMAAMVAESPLPIAYTAASGVAVTLFARFLSPLTAEGATTMARYTAFKRYLVDFGTLEDDPPESLAIWSRHLAWAALFKVADRTLSGLGLRVPRIADAPDFDPIRAWLASSARRTR